MTDSVLSAALVVHDDERRLAACLRSLQGVVDDVVVYLAGCADASRSVARAAGARLIDGTPDHDPATARNAAVQQCRGTWVLSLDADERVAADDALVLHSWLAEQSADVCTVAMHVTSPAEPGGWFDQWQPRLIRRDGVGWTGRVHERIDDEDPLDRAEVPTHLLRLVRNEAADPDAARARAARHVVLGAAEVARLQRGEDPDTLAATLLDLGTDLLAGNLAGHATQALLVVRRLLDGGPTWAQATDRLARISLESGHYELALTLAGELRGDHCDGGYCGWLSAQALLGLDDPGAALAALEPVTELVDPAGHRFDAALVETLRARAADLALRRELAG